jgi:TatD DNase family protein
MFIDFHTHHQHLQELALIDKVHFDGIHPWFIEIDIIEDQMANLEKKLINNELLLIGETGLDRLKSIVDFDLQRTVFLTHLELAKKYNKPIVIHCLKAHSDFLQILKNNYPQLRYVIHDFSGGEAELKKYLKFDIYFSFGKSIFRENSKAQTVFKKVPIDRLFFETDDHQDLKISDVYLKAMELTQFDYEKQVEQNFLRFFNYSNDISPADIIKNFTRTQIG